MNLRTFEELIAEESTINSQQELSTHISALTKLAQDLAVEYDIEIKPSTDKSKYIIWPPEYNSSGERAFDIPLFSSCTIKLSNRIKASKFKTKTENILNKYLVENKLPGQFGMLFHTGYKFFYATWRSIPLSKCGFTPNARDAKASDY